MAPVYAALAGGLIGSIVGPVVLEEYRRWRRERQWAAPRKILLKKMLNDPNYRFKSIEKLARTTGTIHDKCRSLLIELGARGARMKASGKEG